MVLGRPDRIEIQIFGGSHQFQLLADGLAFGQVSRVCVEVQHSKFRSGLLGFVVDALAKTIECEVVDRSTLDGRGFRLQPVAMTTVGRLARSFGLSRSTLLYYDSIGLLEPSGRSAKGYRLYTEEDAQRLEQICRYRKTGVSLQEIKHLLEAPGSRLAEILERRLDDLNGEIHDLQRSRANSAAYAS